MSRFVHISVVVVLLAGGAIGYGARAWRLAHALPPEEAAAIPERLASLPLETKDPVFRGTREILTDRIVKLSGAEHYATIVYRAEDSGTVRLHVGAATGTDAWLHEPTVCLPSHGWTTKDTKLVPIWNDLPGVDPGTQVWRMTLHKTGEQLLVYYWFQWGNHLLTTKFERRWLRFKTLMAGEQDRPIQIVILYSPVDGKMDAAEVRVESLVRALWSDLANVLSPGANEHVSSSP